MAVSNGWIVNILQVSGLIDCCASNCHFLADLFEQICSVDSRVDKDSLKSLLKDWLLVD